MDECESKIKKFRNAILVKVSGDAGIPLPMKLDPIDEEHQFPINITDVSPNRLGELNSYWTAQLSHANFSLADADIRYLYAEEKYNKARSGGLLEISNNSESRVLKDVLESQVEQRPEVEEWKQKMLENKALVIAMKNLVDAFKNYVFCISREMSRRKIESDIERNGI